MHQCSGWTASCVSRCAIFAARPFAPKWRNAARYGALARRVPPAARRRVQSGARIEAANSRRAPEPDQSVCKDVAIFHNRQPARDGLRLRAPARNRDLRRFPAEQCGKKRRLTGMPSNKGAKTIASP